MSADAEMYQAPASLADNYPLSKDWKFNSLATKLSGITLMSLPWSTRRNMLTTLSINTSVYEALQILSDKNIHSAPVFDEMNNFYGFTDMMQLTRYIVRLFTGKTFDTESDASVLEMKQDLKDTTIKDLFRGNKTWQPISGEFAWPISSYASLYQCFERMAREGQHRLAVQDSNNQVCAVVTQSMMIKWLSRNMDCMTAAGRNTKVIDLRPFKFLVTIRNSASALRAFELMDQQRFSMNGLAVVDATGKLVDAISTYDLKGLLPSASQGEWRSHFRMLYGTVQHFKDGLRRRHPGQSKYWPVSVLNNATLEDVVSKMAKDNLHRVFVVDFEGKPVDVISQTDIMRYCLDHMSETPIYWS